MPSIQLPILTLAAREQRYSCHGCGNCCRDFTVQLRENDLKKLASQEWDKKLAGQGPITIDFRGQTYLRQREDGSCIFLMDNGLCRVHAEFGFEAKPIACQLFPFHLTPSSKGIEMGINFACQSVLENKGAELRTHGSELRRMSAALPELDSPAPSSPPKLTDRLRASEQETQSLISHIDGWIKRTDITLSRRIDGLAWVVSSLAKARLENVRGDSFDDLLDVLFGALPGELEHYPLQPPSARQRRMLRRAVFARTEDPKLNVIEKQGRWRITLSQLARSWRFKTGKGIAPKIGEGWPVNARMESIDTINPATHPGSDLSRREANSQNPIDDLITRYLRATVLGGRCWGAGYYGWNMIAGLQAMLLNVAVIGWLARLHAAGRISQSIDIEDVRAALGRVDRSAGRAKWLGGATERLRLTYFNLDDGLRRVIANYALTAD